jgi:uncharacterized repeat protein (TIGR03943 family)
LGALPLIGWASLFWFLLFTGRTPLYLGARTQWLVGVGAAILTAAALGRVASLRETSPARVTAGRAWGTALLLVPVVLVTSLPPASLTSYAVGRRSTVSSGGISSTGDIGKGDLTLVDVASALASRPTMRALVQRAGSTESFKGFVDMVPGESADEFELTRFVVTCCVADAIAAQVRVVGAAPGTFHPDEWVRVTGTIYPLGQQIILVADKVVGVAKPSRPYLYP